MNSSQGPAAIETTTGADGPIVKLEGQWTLRGMARGQRRLARELARQAQLEAAWDLTGISALDSAGALLLWRCWQRRRPSHVALLPEHESRFEGLAAEPQLRLAPGRSWMQELLSPFVTVGSGLFGAGRQARDLLVLLGQLLLDLVWLVRQPRLVPAREISATLYRAGARALGITGLVGFLVGLILAYLSAGQLRSFGAEELIVNLVGIGVFRELGPLLGCMLLAGRSGSAMTAELGAMRLTQEVDALTVLGISPSIRLILPKVMALGLIAPLIALWTSSLGMVGGMLVAMVEIGMAPLEFYSRLQDVLPIEDVIAGTFKSITFGVAIGLVACHHGLRVKPDTQSLGEETTSSVVMGLTLVIALDAIFAIALRGYGSG